MVNSDDFSKRLQEVIDYYGESASAFAESIGVQRSSISHILSGRNKPSLDFVMKIINSYPEVELYWLLNGKGHFPPDKKMVVPENLFTTPKSEIPPNTQHIIKKETPGKKIERIVIFYSDGSFENFQN
ncbi:DNA-binding protein [Pseudalgibacter alginicilyticus]|uniref:DNA-binding protein n=1 Tax=Pseudalgibacter alginicilyticus TaxID=1736674 RepID=A0A0P0D8L0_9FLAO|nr:helix-turn-helix transcriptional regulator [Pseudalgibacter alginicilyticus]ALJ04051.1 DNA-binding protein [Pseudalgibacter alginicilyticus]